MKPWQRSQRADAGAQEPECHKEVGEKLIQRHACHERQNGCHEESAQQDDHRADPGMKRDPHAVGLHHDDLGDASGESQDDTQDQIHVRMKIAPDQRQDTAGEGTGSQADLDRKSVV